MIEIPEAIVLAKQINETVLGKRINNVIAAQSPHKFAWYYGDPEDYKKLLTGKVINGASSVGGYIDITADDVVVLFGDGINLRLHSENEKRPPKHQLLIEFEGNMAISASVQMYGGIWCFKNGQFDNPYYLNAKEKPSPISDKFNREYYNSILSKPGVEKLSAKALLATEQRIPGLGNGTLQDILFNAKIHPKKKVSSFTQNDNESLYLSIKSTLEEMIMQGGRDTERDLFGNFGSYKTKVSKNTVNKQCDVCGNIIVKEAYLGGSIYYCPCCQDLGK